MSRCRATGIDSSGRPDTTACAPSTGRGADLARRSSGARSAAGGRATGRRNRGFISMEWTCSGATPRSRIAGVMVPVPAPSSITRPARQGRSATSHFGAEESGRRAQAPRPGAGAAELAHEQGEIVVACGKSLAGKLLRLGSNPGRSYRRFWWRGPALLALSGSCENVSRRRPRHHGAGPARRGRRRGRAARPRGRRGTSVLSKRSPNSTDGSTKVRIRVEGACAARPPSDCRRSSARWRNPSSSHRQPVVPVLDHDVHFLGVAVAQASRPAGRPRPRVEGDEECWSPEGPVRATSVNTRWIRPRMA